MANTNYYERKILIPKENEEIFKQKNNLNTIEKIGLEAILIDFIKQHEEIEFGEIYTNIEPYTRYNENSIDILDGYQDTYIFECYAISEIWMTENGIPMLSAIDLTNYLGDEKEFYEENSGDFYTLIDHFDIYCDFESVTFRLD